MKRIIVLATSLALPAAAAHVLTACADSSEASAEDDSGRSTVPTGDDGSFPIDDGGTPDGCDAADPSCGVALTCETAAFCAADVALDPRYSLLSVHGSSKDDVWTAGAAGTLLHYDGIQWTPMPSGKKDTLRAVWVHSPTNFWVIGSGTAILHGTGGAGPGLVLTDTPLTMPAQPGSVNPKCPAVWASPDGATVLMGGGLSSQGGDPRAPLWSRPMDGTASGWTADVASGAAVRVPFNALWGNATDLWRVGAQGMAARASGFWTRDAGTIAWERLDPRTTQEMTAITGFEDGSVWMVGNNGTVRRYSGGEVPRFDVVEVPATEDLHGIWGSSSTDIWIVGDDATILHYSGGAWTRSTVFTRDGSKPDLYSIWGADGRNVWAVGAGVILHLNPQAASGDAP